MMKHVLKTVIEGLESARSWTLLLCVVALPTLAAGDAYDDLVTIFHEFRDLQDVELKSGVPDYTPEAMQRQFRALQSFQQRLANVNSVEWPLWQQVDYHLVRAEMNALEFYHKAHRPWSRDPGFYTMFAGDAGASIQSPAFFGPVYDFLGSRSDDRGNAAPAGDEAIAADRLARLQSTLRGIPRLYRQARRNLTEAAADFAAFAIRNLREDREVYARIAEQLAETEPAIAADAEAAAGAVSDYIDWLKANRDDMAEYAGLGKRNYDWWMRNVQLSPWGWEDSNRIIEGEYNRVITFLKLEEQRNRDLPPLPVATTEKAWADSLRQALHYVVDFVRDKEIMTLPEWVNPADYYAGDAQSDLSEAVSADFLPENTSIDTKVRQREILPGETHEYLGHMLDEQRQSRLTRSPIRRAGRRFNMGSMRLEGWAVALEELLMQAGVLDERPRRGREMEYLMNASHMSLAIPDMKMHANEIGLAEARRLCADIMPRGWTREHEDMVWFEMQSNLRNPGGFHSNVVTGKAYFMKLFREAAQAKGDEFVIRDFVDRFLAAGTIPMSLIRWEISGLRDDVALVAEALEAGSAEE